MNHTAPRSLLSLLVFTFAAVTAVPAAQAQRRLNIENLDWLAGSWKGDVPNGRVDETWTEPAGRTILGTNRVVSDRRTVVRDFMVIEQFPDGVYLTMRSVGEKTAEGDERPQLFRLTTLRDQEAEFQTQGGMPRRLLYRIERDGTLFVRFDSVRDGKPVRIEFRMKRVASNP